LSFFKMLYNLLLRSAVMNGNQVICYIRDNIVERAQVTEGPLGKLSLDQYIELVKEVTISEIGRK
jgi:hypothetical protein